MPSDHKWKPTSIPKNNAVDSGVCWYIAATVDADRIAASGAFIVICSTVKLVLYDLFAADL